MTKPGSWEGIAQAQHLRGIIRSVQEASPMVHFLSSSVAMPFVADGLLAAGARPMMTASPTDAPPMCACADSVVVNLATLTHEAMAAIQACEPTFDSKPWVLDPAAIGVPPARTALAHQLLAAKPSVIRANASEVLALIGGKGGRGADTTASVDDAREAGGSLAENCGAVVAISGPCDLITDGRRVVELARGVARLARVNGTGCLLGALIAACLAVETDAFVAAAAGSAWLCLAGERAQSKSSRSGSFRVALIDALEEVAQ